MSRHVSSYVLSCNVSSYVMSCCVMLCCVACCLKRAQIKMQRIQSIQAAAAAAAAAAAVMKHDSTIEACLSQMQRSARDSHSALERSSSDVMSMSSV